MAVSHCAVPPAQSAFVSTLKGPSSPPQRTTGMDNTHPNGHKERQDQLQQLSIASSSSSSSPSSSPSPPPSLFTPIWDYDRFPVGPCVRRLSQEQQNPFLIDYSQQHHHHRSQSSSASSSKAMMRSASSSSSTGDANVVSTSNVTGPHSRRGSRHYESNKQASRNVSGGQSVLGGAGGSVGGSSGMVIGTSSHGLPTGTTTSALNGVVSFSCSPSSAHIPHSHIHTHTCMGVATADTASDAADAVANQEHQPQQESSSWSSSPPATISKFDQYIAQKERIRSTRASTTSLSSSSGRGPATAVHSTTLNNTATTTITSSPALASASASCPSGSPTLTPTSSPAKKTGSFFPRLFKSKSKNNNTKALRDRRTDPTQPQPQLPTPPSGTRSHDSSMRQQETLPSSPGSCSSSSQSSLLHEKEAAHFSTRRRRPSASDPEKTGLAPTGRTNTSAPATITTAGAGAGAGVGTSQSPIQEQQDRWRDEWLRPSGAIHSMFRDRPSKFNCPHCGAIKVVSHIQFVPGVMSYLVAFGLLFLTLGTLSYLPFRKDHEGTKDCLHWCPECGRKVARFNRANSTWEWV